MDLILDFFFCQYTYDSRLTCVPLGSLCISVSMCSFLRWKLSEPRTDFILCLYSALCSKVLAIPGAPGLL